ncbi:MAG: tetratricopeptide repeat protein, partial [Desulfobacteraceae bacterium]
IWLQRIEDLLYYETDAELDADTVRAYGRRLRETFHRWVADFAVQIKLKDDASLLVEQADFLSRLGMTFSHGDYARVEGARHPEDVARQLYQRALSLHPDHRAFWGLALVHQRHGELEAAMEILQRGLRHHSQSPELTTLVDQIGAPLS